MWFRLSGRVLKLGAFLGALIGGYLTIQLALRFTREPQLDFPTCKAEIQNGTIGQGGWVDRNGDDTEDKTLIMGVRYIQCQVACGAGWQREEWNDIFSSVAGWLLPWLALTAQLPFQTRNKTKDLESVLIVIGSPILAVYSLLLTFYNKRWVVNACKAIARNHRGSLSERKKFTQRMRNVADVLVACQHAPVNFIDPSLLEEIMEKNEEADKWWNDVAASLRDTERKVPASLWGQLLLAGLSYTFTLIVAFGIVGDKPTGYGLALGITWVWIVPLVYGWYAVRTQVTRNSVQNAIDRANRRLKCLLSPPRMVAGDLDLRLPSLGTSRPTSKGKGKAVASQHSMDDARSSSTSSDPVNPGGGSLSSTDLITSEHRGALTAVSAGPSTSKLGVANTSQTRHSGYDSSHGGQSTRNSDNFAPQTPSPPIQDSDTGLEMGIVEEPVRAPENNVRIRAGQNPAEEPRILAGDEKEPGPLFNYARSCPLLLDKQGSWLSLADKVISVHRGTAQLPDYRSAGLNFFSWYFFFSFLFHFGPLSAAFVLSYMTPTVGLGCRSGPLIVVCLGSLISAGLHIRAAYLFAANHPKKTAARLFRSGRIIAYLNCIWFLVHCHFQFIGYYRRCWCWASWLSRGNDGYVTFLSDADTRDEAIIFWAACFGVSTSLMAIYFAYFVWTGSTLSRGKAASEGASSWAYRRQQ